MKAEDQSLRTTDIHGRVTLESPMAVLPGPVRVQLIRNGVVMGETMSSGGLFRFEGKFPPGTYLVRGRTSGFAGEVSVDVGGETSKDVRLLLEKKKGAEI